MSRGISRFFRFFGCVAVATVPALALDLLVFAAAAAAAVLAPVPPPSVFADGAAAAVLVPSSAACVGISRCRHSPCTGS